MKRVPTFLSVFAGIGGFDLGLERAGWRSVGQIEINDFCNRVLARHWPGVPRWGDIRTVSAAALQHEGERAARPGGRGVHPGADQPAGGIDLLCGGFPCQDLSVAGRRAGLAGARSSLFFELVRLARTLQPRWLLLENVPGLLSSNGGDDFRIVLAALGDAGYGVGWRVLDARWFGVPQRRRRVFLVGRLGAPCPAAVLVEPAGVRGHLAAGGEAGAALASGVGDGAAGGGWRVGADEAAARQLVAAPAYALTAPGGKGGDPTTDTMVTAFAWQQGDDSPHTGTGRGRSWVARAGDYTGALSTTRHDAVAFNHIQDPVSSPSVGATLGQEGQAVAVTSGPKMWDDRGIDRGTVSTEVTPTLNGFEQPMVLPSVRRLTPTECERLQGFDDGHTCLCGVEPYSTWDCRCPDGPRYAALGNAVCVPVVEWLGRRILAAEREYWRALRSGEDALAAGFPKGDISAVGEAAEAPDRRP